jgi:flagellar biosynthesis protein FlhG
LGRPGVFLERPHAALDQAAGLRRLFGVRPPQVIAFVSGSNFRRASGQTSLLVHTASALGQAGHAVVIVDENPEPDNVWTAFGMTAKHDLLDVVQDGKSVQQVMQSVAPMIRVLAAQRFATEMQHIDAEAAERLDNGLRQMQQGAAFVLVDCALQRGGRLSPLAFAARHLAILVTAQDAAITQAYSLIKRLAKERRRDQFHVVVTQVRAEAEAQAVFENLRRTAQQHLRIRLEFLGALRPAEHLAESLQRRLPTPGKDAGDSGFRTFQTPRQVHTAVL